MSCFRTGRRLGLATCGPAELAKPVCFKQEYDAHPRGIRSGFSSTAHADGAGYRRNRSSGYTKTAGPQAENRLFDSLRNNIALRKKA